MSIVADVLYWGCRFNLVIAILAHVKMPAPLGQLFMFDMLGRLGSTISEDFTFFLLVFFFATSLLFDEIYDELWIPNMFLISIMIFLNYAYTTRFDTKSMERAFLEAGLRLKARGNLNVRAEDCRKSIPIIPCPSRLAPLIAPSSSLIRVADIPTSKHTSVDVWYDPSTAPPRGGRGRPVFLYYHGGAWLFGSKRFNHCAILLWLLARQGFVVVSARYRFAPRVSWNEMFQDALNALNWLQSFNANTKKYEINSMLRDKCGVGEEVKLFISGSSAGAHICSCVLSHALSRPERYDRNMFRGTVLYYPPLDIKNISKSQIEFPFTLKALNVRQGQCLMLWFWYEIFEREIARIQYYSITNREVFLRPSKHDETSWNPYETMLPEKLPPMLILQGTMDSVVGMNTVRSYFEKLVRERTKKSDDLLVLLEGGRHAFDYMLSESTFVAANGVSAWLHRNLL